MPLLRPGRLRSAWAFLAVSPSSSSPRMCPAPQAPPAAHPLQAQQAVAALASVNLLNLPRTSNLALRLEASMLEGTIGSPLVRWPCWDALRISRMSSAASAVELTLQMPGFWWGIVYNTFKTCLALSKRHPKQQHAATLISLWCCSASEEIECKTTSTSTTTTTSQQGESHFRHLSFGRRSESVELHTKETYIHMYCRLLKPPRGV